MNLTDVCNLIDSRSYENVYPSDLMANELKLYAKQKEDIQPILS